MTKVSTRSSVKNVLRRKKSESMYQVVQKALRVMMKVQVKIQRVNLRVIRALKQRVPIALIPVIVNRIPLHLEARHQKRKPKRVVIKRAGKDDLSN